MGKGVHLGYKGYTGGILIFFDTQEDTEVGKRGIYYVCTRTMEGGKV